MTDDDLLLAAAYLDGDLDATDRARVEADDELWTLVEQQRQVRALLADVEPPSIARREEHLAAALDAWDRVPEPTRAADRTPTGVAAISTPTARSTRRRSADRNRRLLAAAAPAVVVVAAGVTLQTFTGIDDGDDGNDAARLEADDAGAAGTAGAVDDAESADDAAAGALPAGEADEALDNVDGTLDVGTDAEAPPPPPELDLEQLRSPDDLAIFASDALAVPTVDTELGDGDATGEIDLPLCLGADLLVGPARYRDVVVVVGIDEGRRLALAYLPDGCVEIARASVPAGGP